MVARAVAAACFFCLCAFRSGPATAASAPDSLAYCQGLLVSRVDVTGFKTTKEFVIRREIHTAPGDTFRVDRVRRDLTRLENLGIFSSASVTVETADSTVALTYHVREMPWLIPYPRLRYTEEDGWSIGAGVTSVNLFGRAIYATGYFLVGGLDSYALRFNYPWITGDHVSFDLLAADFRRFDTLNEFNEHSRELTPWLGRWIGERGRVAATVSYFRMNSDVDGITLSPDGQDEFLRAGIRIGYDSRNAWRSPRHGWQNEVLVMGYDAGPFDEPGQWWLAEVDLRHFRAIGEKNSCLFGSLVSLQTGNVGVDFPTYLQYRMGGANSIRGYDIEELGQTLYGRNQWILTTEVQRMLSPVREYRVGPWSFAAGLKAAAFVDWGIAGSGSDEFETRRSRAGFGVGLRWIVPAVYELRTDVAIGDGGKIYVHLGVGDKLTAQRSRLR
jgi:outer membrane protein insertion porin family